MENEPIIPNLFRTEYRKIISVLVKHFGIDEIELAEDIASDTFATAAQIWPLKGVPSNPVAWLYTVARNKTVNILKRQMVFKGQISPELIKAHTSEEIPEPDLSDQNITDSQLQMMFAICHHSISQEAQVGLALRILCGFGIGEIADAFLTSKETINKRLQRAKEKLKASETSISMPPAEKLEEHLDTVLTMIYLLFNEGYYSRSHNETVLKELCHEAMRL